MMHNPFSTNRVIFEKPKPKELSEDGFLCVDMHLHSRCSDGSASVSRIIKKAKKNSFGVAITDHNAIRGSLQAIKHSTKKFPVVPGIEVNTSSGRDILLHFYDTGEMEEFYRNNIRNFGGVNPNGKLKKDLYEILDRASETNCLITAPHPCGLAHKNLFRKIKKDVSYEYLDKIHALEILNGEMPRKINRNAIVWNYNLDKGFTGGSDGHTLREIGDVLTCSRAENVEEFLDNIKKKKNFVMGVESSVRRKAAAYPYILKRHAPYFHPELIEKMGNNRVVNKFRKKPKELVVKEIKEIEENIDSLDD